MVKTIKKQKRTVAFRKTKTTALQNGKVKKVDVKLYERRKIKKAGEVRTIVLIIRNI